MIVHCLVSCLASTDMVLRIPIDKRADFLTVSFVFTRVSRPSVFHSGQRLTMRL